MEHFSSLAQSQPQFKFSKRIKIVYILAVIETSLLISLIFFQPVFTKLYTGHWNRYGMIVQETKSLNYHVLFAVPYLFFFIFQFIFGFLQNKWPLFKQLHRYWGRFILAYTPIFLILTIWNVKVRVPYLLLELTFHITVINIAYFLIRGFWAIKNKKILIHVESMLGAFILSGIAATARLVYFVYLYFFNQPPLTALWLLLASAILYLKLAFVYGLAGRLRQNYIILVCQTLPLILIYIFLPWPKY